MRLNKIPMIGLLAHKYIVIFSSSAAPLAVCWKSTVPSVPRWMSLLSPHWKAHCKVPGPQSHCSNGEVRAEVRTWLAVIALAT